MGLYFVFTVDGDWNEYFHKAPRLKRQPKEKEYTKLLKGDISVQSEIGIGTTFKLELPLGISTTKIKPGGIVKEKEVIGTGIEIKKRLDKKILYVDDDYHSREAVTRILSKYYSIDSAENADEISRFELFNFIHDTFLAGKTNDCVSVVLDIFIFRNNL